MSFLFGKCLNAMMVSPSQYSQMRSDINLLSGMFFLLGVCQFVVYFFLQYILGKHSEHLVFKMRSHIFKHFLRMDISFFDNEKNSSGSLISIITKDGQSIEGLGGATLGQVLNSAAVLLGGLILAIVVNWRLGLVVTACMPILVGCGFLRVNVLTKIEERARSAYEYSSNYACEGINAIRTVASLTREEELLDVYNQKIKAQVRRSRIPLTNSSLIYGLSQGLTPLVMGLGFWYGSTLIRKGQSDAYEFFTAFTAVVFGSQSAGQMFSFAPSMGKARQAAQNFLQLLDIKPEIDPLSAEGKTVEHGQGKIEFCDVHFRYPTRRHVPVLRGVNFKVNPGQFVALVGPSGCGKSTSISLIEQFYRPLAGQILLDGVDISSLNVGNYRKYIGLVQQEPVLYQGTIRENILMGLSDSDTGSIDEEVLFSASRKANIHDFIMSLPDRYETLCGPKGALLSGGQKQRIAIARALIRDPKVLLLDEATSALDSESEKVVQAALDAAAAGRTTVAVAHRLSTIQNADKICVFDKGKIVEEGTHDELLEKRGIYFTLVKMQALEGK